MVEVTELNAENPFPSAFTIFIPSISTTRQSFSPLSSENGIIGLSMRTIAIIVAIIETPNLEIAY
jgi:hypothetical protein